MLGNNQTKRLFRTGFPLNLSQSCWPLRSDLFCFQKPDARPKCGFRGLFTAAGGSEQRGSGVSTKQRGSIEPNSSVASIIMAFTESSAKTLQAIAATVFVQCV